MGEVVNGPLHAKMRVIPRIFKFVVDILGELDKQRQAQFADWIQAGDPRSRRPVGWAPVMDFKGHETNYIL